MLRFLYLASACFSLPQQTPFQTNAGSRLISTAQGQSKWMSEGEIFELYRSNTKFIDVTSGIYTGLTDDTLQASSAKAFPTAPRQKKHVADLLELIEIPRMTNFLDAFSAFHTRYYKSKTGKQSSIWLYDQIVKLGEDYASKDVIFSVRKFKHDWAQHSVIATLCPANNASSDDIIILSAHQDSVNQWNPWFGRSPGADDDGSGATTVFEALRVILAGKHVPSKTIEFHWYSAEEGGLLGSQDVVGEYVAKGKSVRAVYHNDMTGYLSDDTVTPSIGIVTDYVNLALVPTLEMLAAEYSGQAWVHTTCGYACSDHATWTKAGIPSVFSFEGAFKDHSPFIHTVQDTTEHIDFTHMTAFVKTAIGFAIEMAN